MYNALSKAGKAPAGPTIHVVDVARVAKASQQGPLAWLVRSGSKRVTEKNCETEIAVGEVAGGLSFSCASAVLVL